jgi:DNA-binding NtrC family response regulator
LAKLLVIGTEELCNLLSEVLREKKFMVECATKSSEAFALLQNDIFDLILCDFRLHDPEGFSMISQIRAIRSNTPLVLLSNNPNLSTFIEAIREGAVDCISDPLSSSTLLSSVYNALANDKNGSPKPDNTPLDLKKAAHRAELAVIFRVLEETHYNHTRTAQILNIDRKTLYNKLKLLEVPGDGQKDGKG